MTKEKNDEKQEIKKSLNEIDNLKKIEKNLKEEIAKLQVIHNNLDAQSHTAQIKEEQDAGIKNNEKMAKYAAEENRLESKRIEIEKRIDFLSTKEARINDSEREVEKREQELIDLEDNKIKLNLERSNFNDYKISVEKELVNAQEIINDAAGTFDKIKIDNEMLKGREIKVVQQEKYWNDTIGKLEADKKKFEIERENFLGLGQAKQKK